jgi:hypothetical protein
MLGTDNGFVFLMHLAIGVPVAGTENYMESETVRGRLLLFTEMDYRNSLSTPWPVEDNDYRR